MRNFAFLFGKYRIVTGSANFASMIQTAFATYGLSSAQQAAFATLNTALQSAYTAAITPETRTSAAILTKNQAITNMRANAKTLAKVTGYRHRHGEQFAAGVAPGFCPAPFRRPGRGSFH